MHSAARVLGDAAQLQPQLLGVVGVVDGVFDRDEVLVQQFFDRLVERLAAEIFSFADRAVLDNSSSVGGETSSSHSCNADRTTTNCDESRPGVAPLYAAKIFASTFLSA